MKRIIATGFAGIAAMLLTTTAMAGDAKVFETKSAINNLSTVMVDGG